jgi:hypothetical protein
MAQLFGKIFQQMYDSTVCEDWRAMVTFQQLIVLANEKGEVDMTPEAISRRTNIPLEEVILPGLEKLLEKDKRSRSKQKDGRRIVPLKDAAHQDREYGWVIPTFNHYTFIIAEEQKRKANAERQRRYRERKA